VSASAGVVTATAVDFMAKDNATSKIIFMDNDLEAVIISIGSYSVPSVYSDFTAVEVSLLNGCGVIMESAANNKADITFNEDNRLWADTVVIDSGVYSSDDKYTVYTDLTGIAASGLSVVLNKASTNTNIEVSTSVGSLTLKTEEETDSYCKKKKVGKSDVYIGAWDATKVKNRVEGVTVGVIIASGSNHSKSEINSTVTTNVAAGSEGLYANNLMVEANSWDTVDSLVNGDGGGIVGVNPKAAVVDAEVTGVTTVDLSGVFNVTSDLLGGAVRQDDLRYVAEAAHAQVAGGSDVEWGLTGKENTNVNINNATIDSGSADLQSSTITGNKVVLYTESGDTQMGFDKAVVGQELTLAGNHWNKDWGEMFDVVMENGCNIRLYSAGRTNDGAVYNLDFGDTTNPIYISEVVADTLKMKTNGPVTIQDLSVSNIAEITAMGTKTDVYGVFHPYDADAKVIYYAPGRGAGASIDLHDMFFDGTAASYQDVMDQYKQDSRTDFVKAGNAIGSGVDGNGRGMYLDIHSATEQTGNGLLLRNYYGQSTHPPRFSLEQCMQHLLNIKAIDQYKEYFNKGIEIFQRYNLLEIPNVTVNQPINLKEGGFEIELTGTDEEGKKAVKTVKYDF